MGWSRRDSREMRSLKTVLVAAVLAIESVVLATPAQAASSAFSASTGGPFPPLLGYRDTHGDFYVKQGLLAGWVKEIASTAEALTYTPGGSLRIGVLDSGGNFLVKEGGLHAGWTLVASSAREIALSADLIAYSDFAGRLYVKRGALGAGWVLETTGPARGVALTYTPAGALRIGFLDSASNFWVKEGSLTAAWTLVASWAGYLAGDLIAYEDHPLHYMFRAFVKQGPLTAPWVNQAVSIFGIPLAITYTRTGSLRIGIVDEHQRLQVRDGSLTAGWTAVADLVNSIALSGDIVEWQDRNGNVFVQRPLRSSTIFEANFATTIAVAGG